MRTAYYTMPVADFVKDIEAKKVKAVQERLKKEKPNQKWTPDSKNAAVFSTLLHVAVATGDALIVEALLAAGADVGAVDQDDCTPLHWASRSGGSLEAPKIAGA